ncbi:MAG: sensor histidine kinase [Aeromicrobium sp.]
MRALPTFQRVVARIEEKEQAHGMAFPWWIPLFSIAGHTGAIIFALWQRDHLTLVYAAAVISLVTVPLTAQLLIEPWVPWWPTFLGCILAASLVLSLPPTQVGAQDAVSLFLLFVVAEQTAKDGARRGLFAAAVAIALLVTASATDHLDPLFVHLVTAFLGFCLGFMLFSQTRALAAERAARAVEHHRATLAERDRIAREIHDLVAHSLSVTMLHITGARRMLADSAAANGDDIEEAIEALRDAERVGRQAMSDIRQTVSELATEGDPNRPLPSAEDLPTLIDRVRGAGLTASYDVRGDVGRLPPALGLGLFRIVQESLTNVTKHAPGSPAHVSLAVGRTDARLTVRSTRTVPHHEPDGSGSGITGMTARVEQLGGTLTSESSGDHWVVEAMLPITGEAIAADGCVISRSISGMAQPKVEEART